MRASQYSTLVFREGLFGRLRAALLAHAPLESACFVLARAAPSGLDRWRFIVADTIELKDTDYIVRTEASLELQPSTLAKAAKVARQKNLALILSHTHPVQSNVRPSITDRNGEARWAPAVRRRVSPQPVGRLIIGPTSAHCAVLDDSGVERGVRVAEVGHSLEWLTDESEQEPADLSATHRQELMFGALGQRRLESLHVGIIGCGGTGSMVIQQLAHLGVREFTLIDPDDVEHTNLNRLVGATAVDVGRAKADVAANLVAAIRPGGVAHAVRGDICDAAVVRKLLTCDFFFCCTDSEGSRAILNQMAYQYFLPGIDLGVAIRIREGRVTHISGRVQALSPDRPCLLCSEVLNPEQVRRDLLSEEARSNDRYIDGARVPQPAVISINTVTAGFAVSMMLSMVTSIPGPRNQRIRFESGTVSCVEVERRASCPVCSTMGALGRADSFIPPGRGTV